MFTPPVLGLHGREGILQRCQAGAALGAVCGRPLTGFSCWAGVPGTWAQPGRLRGSRAAVTPGLGCCGVWGLPRPRIGPVLAGGFFTSEPPGKPRLTAFKKLLMFALFSLSLFVCSVCPQPVRVKDNLLGIKMLLSKKKKKSSCPISLSDRQAYQCVL